MTTPRRRRAASARASIFTRLRNRLFRRRRATISPAMSAYLLMERRRATIEPEMDICEQETGPMPRVDTRTPVHEYWFYAEETTLEPAR